MGRQNNVVNIFLIVNYNDYDNTFKLLKNIKNYNVIDEIVVVDNNSNIECKNKLKEIKIKRLTILLSSENRGYGSAINIGCRYIKKKYGNANV